MKQFTLILMAATALCTQTFAQNRVKNIYTSSTTFNVSALQDADTPAQLNRTLFAGYNSICLPMTLSAEELQNAAPGVQLERLASIKQENGTLYMYFIDCTKEGLEAGVPYLIFSPKVQSLRAKTENATCINTELKDVTMNDGQGNKVTFSGSWDFVKEEGRYGIPAQQDTYVLESVLVRTDGEKMFLPTRCGFTWDSQSTTAYNLEIKHVTSLSGIETSIDKLQADGAKVDVYNAQGMVVLKQADINSALSTLPAGIYVIGGQKVAVK